MTDRRRNWRRPFFGDIFDDFDREFERMRENMDKMFERSLRANREEGDKTKPFVYGFSIRVGPDGIPHIQEFGNTKKLLTKVDNFDEGIGREPLTDIIEDENSISITAELPGVEKDDIDVDMKDTKITIKVDTASRKYHKEVELPEDIDPKSIAATYKNGVLDITINRKKPIEPKSRKIDIE
ncbi:MAG: Hsp20/alpha crystallin family protein [Thermoplasmata archaeon]|nr:MAG: Hsp20/alpha crystallin family protein [Thermoplasmata archaeon]